MNALLLVIALSSSAAAPKAGFPEATAAPKAAPARVALAAADVTPKAVGVEAFLPMGRDASAAMGDASPVPSAQASPDAGVKCREVALDAATGNEAATANAKVFDAALEGAADAAVRGYALNGAPDARSAAVRTAGVLPVATASDACRLADIARRRFLSGPWSAARRLEAARLRGDEAEARRMEALLGELVIEAVVVGDGGVR